MQNSKNKKKNTSFPCNLMLFSTIFRRYIYMCLSHGGTQCISQQYSNQNAKTETWGRTLLYTQNRYRQRSIDWRSGFLQHVNCYFVLSGVHVCGVSLLFMCACVYVYDRVYGCVSLVNARSSPIFRSIFLFFWLCAFSFYFMFWVCAMHKHIPRYRICK